ncbi:pentatricopeptide repeat-containing protein At4g13650 [Brachypodium distachyon]|nr:pentatricopeptide repeat-containing protein At4g13650 [Brachypodium distachyon]XP_024315973.1 pentatricopeptide repeat-containing protein At4g13650 [Brachypodium distachyon]|eukprot:XP_024315972.1 pentatricopeptide repeat-containing protein At4g13650 [Brachypodium distachyon]
MLFDRMTPRGAASFNRPLAGFLAPDDPEKLLPLFAAKCRQYMVLGAVDFACALRACRGSGRRWPLVPEIHAKAIICGLSGYRIIGNLLIDLYAKKGFVRRARRVFEELSVRDNVSWVAVLSGYAQNGLGEEAVRLYREMHRSGVVPTPYVLSSILSACTKTELFQLGRLIHVQVYKQGFFSETFVGNALISLYLRCRSFRLADRVFCDMLYCDSVTFNTLISGHAQCGHGDRALGIFDEMQLSGLSPDSVTIASLLAACSAVGDLRKGKQLHSYLLKAGMSLDYIMEGSLLDLYVKSGDIEEALQIFDSGDRTNVVLWNLMLVAYGQIDDLAKSFDIFYRMLAAGVRPNKFTYPCMLRTCTHTGEIGLGEQIHSLTIKNGFQSDMYVSGVLIDMYSKYGWLDKAQRILDMIEEKDVVSWTSMIAGYVQHEFCKEALETFKEMQACGIWPDNIGLASAISACAGIKAVHQGSQIHARVYVSGYSADVSIWNGLVYLYARCGISKEAFSSFEAIEHKEGITWNGLISGFAQSGLYEEALKVFMKMDQAGAKYNVFTFVSSISASANLADIKQGKQIHARVIKTGYTSETEISNALISLYGKCGSIEDAKMDFFEMTKRNEVSWNTIITCCSQHGRGLEALDLFDQMKQQGLKPSDVTFVGVLTACSHVGLVEEGLCYFKSMSNEHGIHPRPDHYACVVDILGRAGQLDRAKRFVEEMPIPADSMVWRTLLSACKVHKNLEIGEFAAKHLLELEPHDSASYVLLSNAYAVTGKWASRDQIRKIMKDRGVRKEPGRSWIEVKNVVHAFFVGDRLHPLADQIYNFLSHLNDRLYKIGYKQENYHLFHEKEKEGKDPTAFVHSEKLAVAFGLMSLPSCMPLRVIKNLRVCNDCHTWMKFTSGVMGREIVLRDVYRFHHFNNGSCSCGDYW